MVMDLVVSHFPFGLFEVKIVSISRLTFLSLFQSQCKNSDLLIHQFNSPIIFKMNKDVIFFDSSCCLAPRSYFLIFLYFFKLEISIFSNKEKFKKKMACFMQPTIVSYACSCGILNPITKLYFCRYCLKLRCGFCVCHEVSLWMEFTIMI